MPAPNRDRVAYDTALQFDRLVVRIVNGLRATHPGHARELRTYTNRMLGCLHRSNDCVGTDAGRHESIQAAVWMVEALIILIELQNNNIERALVTAAIEVMERVESALRVEGSLPPALPP